MTKFYNKGSFFSGLPNNNDVLNSVRNTEDDKKKKLDRNNKVPFPSVVTTVRDLSQNFIIVKKMIFRSVSLTREAWMASNT